MAIRVNGERIDAVVRRAPYAGGDGSICWGDVTPGLIEAHAHVMLHPTARQAGRSGVEEPLGWDGASVNHLRATLMPASLLFGILNRRRRVSDGWPEARGRRGHHSGRDCSSPPAMSRPGATGPKFVPSGTCPGRREADGDTIERVVEDKSGKARLDQFYATIRGPHSGVNAHPTF